MTGLVTIVCGTPGCRCYLLHPSPPPPSNGKSNASGFGSSLAVDGQPAAEPRALCRHAFLLFALLSELLFIHHPLVAIPYSDHARELNAT